MRELEESKYEVVAGARRLRAAKLAELEKLPVRVVKLTDAEAIEAQCVELFQSTKLRALCDLDPCRFSRSVKTKNGYLTFVPSHGQRSVPSIMTDCRSGVRADRAFSDAQMPTYQYNPGRGDPDCFPLADTTDRIPSVSRFASFTLGTCLPVRLWGIHSRVIVDLRSKMVEVATAQVSDFWRR